jgi:hypothetical protein
LWLGPAGAGPCGVLRLAGLTAPARISLGFPIGFAFIALSFAFFAFVSILSLSFHLFRFRFAFVAIFLLLSLLFHFCCFCFAFVAFVSFWSLSFPFGYTSDGL